jgi:4-hydroxymandelate oxidase
MARWIDEVEGRAAQRLHPTVYGYYRQGAGPQTARDEAEAAWRALRLRPRVLRDVSAVSTATTVLGGEVSTPILVAPTALQDQADPDGDLATARAVAAFGSVVCVSSSTAAPLSALAATGAAWWAQLYVLAERDRTADMVARVAAAGARALVLTVDTPVLGARAIREPHLIRALSGRHVTYYGGQPVPADALRQARDLTLADIGRLRAESGLPVVVKGVLRGEDARDAVQAGAAAVIVSNHGGRQLDAAISTAEALPDVVAALRGSGAEVYVDGGLRHGEHILAALALGARAVLIGRSVIWALASEGEGGVGRLLHDLQAELTLGMTLVGAPSTAELTPDLVVRR